MKKYKSSIYTGWVLGRPEEKFWTLEISEVDVPRSDKSPVFTRKYKTLRGAEKAAIRELEKWNKTPHEKWLEKYSMNLRKWKAKNPKDYLGKGLGPGEFYEANLDWYTRRQEEISEWTQANPSPPLTPGEQAELDSLQGFVNKVFGQENI